MPTNKKRVQAFLSDELYEALSEYKETHDLSVSEAVVKLLESSLSVSKQENISVNPGIANLSEVKKLLSSVLLDLESSLSDWLGNLIEELADSDDRFTNTPLWQFNILDAVYSESELSKGLTTKLQDESSGEMISSSNSESSSESPSESSGEIVSSHDSELNSESFSESPTETILLSKGESSGESYSKSSTQSQSESMSESSTESLSESKSNSVGESIGESNNCLAGVSNITSTSELSGESPDESNSESLSKLPDKSSGESLGESSDESLEGASNIPDTALKTLNTKRNINGINKKVINSPNSEFDSEPISESSESLDSESDDESISELANETDTHSISESKSELESESLNEISNTLNSEPISESSLSHSLGIPKETWFVCCVEKDNSLSFWDGKALTKKLPEASKYKTQGSTARGIIAAQKRYPEKALKVNSLENIEKILKPQD